MSNYVKMFEAAAMTKAAEEAEYNRKQKLKWEQEKHFRGKLIEILDDLKKDGYLFAHWHSRSISCDYHQTWEKDWKGSSCADDSWGYGTLRFSGDHEWLVKYDADLDRPFFYYKENFRTEREFNTFDEWAQAFVQWLAVRKIVARGF